MSMNKYGSIIETFVTNYQLNVVLSTLATPPDDLVLAQLDFTSDPDDYLLYSRGGNIGVTGNPFRQFAVNDQMRCLGYGIFCNLADGLVLNDADNVSGLSLSLTWDSYTGNTQIQTDFASTGGYPYSVRINALNQINACDWRWNFSALSAAADNIRGVGSINTANGATFSTITVNPAFADKQIMMWPVFIIEHSLSTLNVPG